jgi:hypothetical protein
MGGGARHTTKISCTEQRLKTVISFAKIRKQMLFGNMGQVYDHNTGFDVCSKTF